MRGIGYQKGWLVYKQETGRLRWLAPWLQNLLVEGWNLVGWIWPRLLSLAGIDNRRRKLWAAVGTTSAVILLLTTTFHWPHK